MKRRVAQGDFRQIIVQLPDGTSKVGYISPVGQLYIDVDPPPAQVGQQGGKGVTPDGMPQERYRREVGDLPDIPKDISFKQRLASTLKDNAYTRIARNLKRGKLDMKRLYKAGVQSENVFKAKIDRRGKNYNIVLCIDESGSMNGRNIKMAALVAGFLTDNFQSLKINLAVMGYSGGTKIRKGFEESIAPALVQSRLIGDFMGGGTDDNQALIDAYKMCAGRDGESLVIVVTDGQGYPSEILRPLIERNKLIAKTFAIGINSDTPGYPQGVTARSLDELKPLVLNIIKSQIRRG